MKSNVEKSTTTVQLGERVLQNCSIRRRIIRVVKSNIFLNAIKNHLDDLIKKIARGVLSLFIIKGIV